MLKKKLEQQHAWLFGNRMKDLKTKALNLVNSNRDRVYSYNLSVVRSLLLFTVIVIFCYLLKIKIEISSLKNAKPVILEPLKPYAKIVEEYYNLMKKSALNLSATYIDFKEINFEANFLSVITILGFFLQVFLVLREKFSNWWKANEMMVWILLFLTSSVPLDSLYSGQIKILQVCVFVFHTVANITIFLF